LDYLLADLESRAEGVALGDALGTGKRNVDLNVITALELQVRWRLFVVVPLT
jgi:hypothetical protein